MQSSIRARKVEMRVWIQEATRIMLRWTSNGSQLCLSSTKNRFHLRLREYFRKYCWRLRSVGNHWFCVRWWLQKAERDERSVHSAIRKCFHWLSNDGSEGFRNREIFRPNKRGNRNKTAWEEAFRRLSDQSFHEAHDSRLFKNDLR